jgi:hypothetical protein
VSAGSPITESNLSLHVPAQVADAPISRQGFSSVIWNLTSVGC